MSRNRLRWMLPLAVAFGLASCNNPAGGLYKTEPGTAAVIGTDNYTADCASQIAPGPSQAATDAITGPAR